MEGSERSMKEHFLKYIKWYLLGVMVLYIIPHFFLYQWKGFSWETNWGTVIQICILAFVFYYSQKKT